MFFKGKYSCANCKLKAHIRVLLYYTIENFAGAIHAQGRRTVWKSGLGLKGKGFADFSAKICGKRLTLPSSTFQRSFTNILIGTWKQEGNVGHLAFFRVKRQEGRIGAPILLTLCRPCYVRDATVNLSQARPNVLPQFFLTTCFL